MEEHATFDLLPTCRRCEEFARLEELSPAEVDSLILAARARGFLVRTRGPLGFEIRCVECQSTMRRAVRRVIVPLRCPARV